MKHLALLENYEMACRMVQPEISLQLSQRTVQLLKLDIHKLFSHK